MNCAICNSELEQDESSGGNLSFRCPLCNVEKLNSTKARRELPLPGMRDRYKNMRENQSREEDREDGNDYGYTTDDF